MNCIIKKFIKDYDNLSSAKVRSSYGIFAGFVGIIVNVLLSLSKIIVGIITRSVAVMADGLNNLSDAGSSIISLFGFKMSNKKPDEKHPFGHARFEYVSGLIIACIIIFLSFQFAISSFEKITSKSEVTINVVVLIVLAVSIVAKLGLALFNFRLSKKIDSATLKATATDSMNDAIMTTTILICSIITMTTGVVLDGYAGIFLSVVIFVSGVKLIKETLSPLIGEPPSREFIADLITKISSYEGVLGVHDIVAHNYGPHKYYVSLHVEVDRRVDVLKSHDMIDLIETKIKRELGIELVIHMDPIVVDDPEVNKYRQMIELILDTLDDSLTMHDFRAVLGETHNNLIFDIVMPYDCRYEADELKELMQTKVHELYPDCYTVINIDHKY